MKSDKNKNIAIISIPSIDSLGLFVCFFFGRCTKVRFTDRLYAPEGTMVFANVLLFYYVITVFAQQMDFSEWELWMSYLDKVNKFSSIESNI